MKKGFTLIELMIVIAIIALLAAVAVPKFTGATDAAKKSNVLSNLSGLRTSVAMFNVKNGHYPVNGTDFTNNSNALSDAFTRVYSGTSADATGRVIAPTIATGTNVAGSAAGNKDRFLVQNAYANMPTNGNGMYAWHYNTATFEIHAYLPQNAYDETTDWRRQ